MSHPLKGSEYRNGWKNIHCVPTQNNNIVILCHYNIRKLNPVKYGNVSYINNYTTFRH